MALTTSPSLLLRVRNPEDKDAWERFYGFYAPVIIGFSQQRGCNHETALDILQETMVSLMTILPRFDYEPNKGRFRSFLLKIVHRRAIDAFRRQKWTQPLESSQNTERAAQIPDPEPSMPEPEWDRLWRQQLMLQALERVQDKVQPLTYQSFEMQAVKGLPVERVQEELGIPNRDAVYKHRSRVTQLLCKEVELLTAELGE